MTLDEAIKHAEEVAEKKDREKEKWQKWLETDSDHRAVAEKVSCEECSKEHRQLAEWLKELAEYKIMKECGYQLVNVKKMIERFDDMGKRGTLLTGENVTQEDLLMQIIGVIVKNTNLKSG